MFTWMNRVNGRRKRSVSAYFRCRDDDGVVAHATLGLQTERVQGTPLLEPVLRGGRQVDRRIA